MNMFFDWWFATSPRLRQLCWAFWLLMLVTLIFLSSTSGRGNVLAQAEAFRGLGVEIKREINPDLAEQAVSQDEEYRLRSVPEQPNDEAYQRDDEDMVNPLVDSKSFADAACVLPESNSSHS